MTQVQALGTLLEASEDQRTLTYRLLPYGEEGRTSAGRVTASKGSLTLPATPGELVANMEHDRRRPVARATALDEDDDGITATFKVANTTAGNDLLAEAAEGLRTGISVEINDPTIRGGKLVSGLLSGAGFVTQPAFPSAQLVAEDTEPDDEEKAAEVEEIEVNGKRYRLIEDEEPEAEASDEGGEPTDTPEGDEPEGDDDPDKESEDEKEEETVTASKAATVDPALRATAASGGRRTLLASDATPRDLFAMLAKAGDTQDQRLIAELVDITQSGAIGNTEVPQYVGKLWDGRAYQRRYIPLFNHADLTSYKVNGWQWKVADAGDVTEGGGSVVLGEVLKPRVGAYTGDKADVPSNMVKTAPVQVEAERIAGAHDIDRKYRDFGDDGFWQSYIAAMTESYAVQSDAFVLADILAAATDLEGDPTPTDVTDVWSRLVDGAVAVLGNTQAVPSFAILATDMYKQFLLTPQDKGLEYLSAALGLEEGTAAGFRILPSTAVTAGHVVVGVREAVTVHELSTTPIRVEAENIGQGGIDVGVFGYYAVNVHDASGIVDVAPNTP